MTGPPAPDLNALTRVWRQGDCIPEPKEFLFQLDPDLPLTQEARDAVAAAPGTEFAAQLVEGLMVVTQTCDIVKDAASYPFIEVAPLVTLQETIFREARLGARPRFVTVPSLHPTHQAADLDRVLTVEKSCLARWPRMAGCRTDDERRGLSRLLARKRDRPALPDAFAPWIKPLRNRWARLAHLKTPDAMAFEDLQEIRVQPYPSWNTPEVSLFFWFILKDEAPWVDRSQVKTDWLAKLKIPTPPFLQAEGTFTTFEGMKASEYANSDLLDLEYLSPDEEGDE